MKIEAVTEVVNSEKLEGVASDSTVYMYLERETRVNHTFVSRSFLRLVKRNL